MFNNLCNINSIRYLIIQIIVNIHVLFYCDPNNLIIKSN